MSSLRDKKKQSIMEAERGEIMYIHKIKKELYCPTEYALNVFGGKWKSRVLCLLHIKGSLRYKQIKEQTPGITDNVLATVMKDLMAAQLVKREQFNEMPLRVEYSLTEKGESLIPILHSICQWTVKTYGQELKGTVNNCSYAAWREEQKAEENKKKKA